MASVALLAALLAAPGSGCHRGAPSAPPDIVLVVIDTLRADHLGAWGYARDTSPTLDALARSATIFEDATATSSWTRPSMASLFTGRLPSEVGVRTTTDPLDPAWPTVAERLRAAGYRTVGVTANFVHVNEPSGLARGFDPFVTKAVGAGEGGDLLLELELGGGAPAKLRAPTAEELNQAIFTTLDGIDEPRDRPIFLYVHYMDPHSGYLAPEPYAGRFSGGSTGPMATSDYVVEVAAGRIPADAAERDRLVALYDEEIASVDASLGALFAGLAERGIADDGLVIVLADHGEAFAEHGDWFHGITLHRGLLHVPLILLDRRVAGPGRRRSEPVDLLDVTTTLLAAAGLEADPGAVGRDLSGAGPLPPRARVAELEHDRLREDRVGPIRHRRAVSDGPWKALVDAELGIVALRLDQDPGETEPLEIDDPAVPAGLRARARRLAAEAAAVGVGVVPDLGPEDRAALRALGYAE